MGDVLWGLTVAGSAAVAAALLVRRPRHPVTIILVVMTAAHVVAAIGPHLPSGWLHPRLEEALWPLTLPLIAPLLTAFPDGPRGRSGRVLLGYQIGAIAWASLAGAFGAVGAGAPAWWSRIGQVLLAGVLASGVVAVVSLLRHFRRASPDARARMTVVVGVGACIVAFYAMDGFARLLLPPAQLSALTGFFEATFFPLLFGGLPLAVGLSLLHEHPERVVGAVEVGLSWLLRVTLGSILALIVATGLSMALGTSGVDALSLVAVVALLVSAVPGLARLTRRPLRLLDQAEAPGVAALRRLSHDLAAAVDARDVPWLVAATIGEVLPVREVAVELRTDRGSETAARWRSPEPGHADVTPLHIPLVHAGREVGELAVLLAERADERAVAEAVGLVTPHVAAAVDAVTLVRDLERSHARLLEARTEERARLRADLHDELSPGLAGMRLMAGTAHARLANGNPAGAAELVERIEQEATRAVEVIRRILEDLRPLLLEETGLTAALRQRAETFHQPGRFDVGLDLPPTLPQLPLPAEVALFRVYSEALSNAARHSGGSRCDVRLWTDGDALVLEVDDDGVGMDTVRPTGIGLASMRDRVERAGGILVVASGGGGGTIVRARFPFARTEAPLALRLPEPAS